MRDREEFMKNLIRSERIDLFEPNIYIEFLVQITGNPEVEDVVEAVNAAYAANEVTMSRVVLTEDGAAFYEKMDVSGCLILVTENDWETVILENEKIPFQLNRGELVRVFICLADADMKLLIMAHHLAGDGKSVTYLLEDIMMALSGETLTYRKMQLITEQTFPREAKLPRYFKWYAKAFNWNWRRSGRCFSWEDYEALHASYWREYSSRILYESFSAKEVMELKARAKKAGVSVNSYIATAFLRANKEHHCIGMAVDARGDGNRSMSNQATGISADYTYLEQQSFAENTRRLQRKIYQKLERPVMKYFVLQFMALFDPTLIDSILLETYRLYENKTTRKLARVLGYQGKKTRELGITNLTKLEIPCTYGRYGITGALFVPPVVSYAKHIIGVVTMEDGMSISYHYMSCENDAEARTFFEKAIGYIKEKNI